MSEIRNFNPLGRKTETVTLGSFIGGGNYFNPLGRKTETFRRLMEVAYDIKISIHSVARPRQNGKPGRIAATAISIHSVARPRHYNFRRKIRMTYFNPLGRKTETMMRWTVQNAVAFQSTRSQDRDQRGN